MKIRIETIPHEKQRYETCGDWFYDYKTDTLEIKVSILENWKMETSIAVHELLEAVLCMARGIKEQDVTDFDISFEAMRPKGDISEPGDCNLSPYHKEHFFATSLERLLAAELGINWEEYEARINSL